MELIYKFVWRLLHAVLLLHRMFFTWFHLKLQNWNGWLWEWAVLLLTIAPVRSLERHEVFARATGKRSGGRSRVQFRADGKSLRKLPLHIGLLIAEEELSYKDTATLAVWCMAVGISYVSVYDGRGVFSKNSSFLLEEIQRQQRDLLGPEDCKYNMQFLSIGNNKDEHQELPGQPVVTVLSPADGKQSIVAAAQKLCRAVEQKEMSSADVNISMLDALIREAKDIPDPEVVVKFGPVDSTLGFLPWHVRLTEFISLPSHIGASYKDLLGAFQRYASCEQRLGR